MIQPLDTSPQHRAWVRISHWMMTLSFLSLMFTGIEILMVHPRLYWGEAGNDLTPAMLELPISRNYKHGGYEKPISFFKDNDSIISASRTYDIFNENGWGRSLHFLSAWALVIVGLLYLVMGLLTGHFRKRILPRLKEISPRSIFNDIIKHLKSKPTLSPDYNLLQRTAYMVVIFLLFPLMVITGFTMAPALTAAFPFLLDVFGGYQSARTLHFLASITLELFLIIHLLMVILSGFKAQIIAMTIGK